MPNQNKKKQRISSGFFLNNFYFSSFFSSFSDIVRETLRRPVGPLIGFICQSMIMPLIAFGLGYIFYDQPAMRLGLFVTGASPGGGASNIWTLMFGGNLNLSITMTAISTLAAFVMMPAWIFTLGRVIFSEGQLVIPFRKICTYAVCLVVPLGIGLAISKWCPRVSKVTTKEKMVLKKA